MITPIGQFLADLAAGVNPKLRVKSGFQIGVRIVVPPFPFDDDATFDCRSRRTPRSCSRRAIPEEVHIEDVKQVNGQWLVAGTSGVVLIVVRPRPDDAAGPGPGLLAHPQHHDPGHVLPRRHRRALVRGSRSAAHLGLPARGVIISTRVGSLAV